MTKYEFAVVLNGKLEEEAKVEAIEKVKATIERFGGVISDVDDWGKRRLAYEIEKIREGFYYFIHFESETSAPIEIEKRVRIMEPVIRFLNIRVED